MCVCVCVACAYACACNAFLLDGRSVGVTLEPASEAELAQLDQLLTQLADLKTAEEVSKMTTEAGEDKKEPPKGEPTWGSSVAGVRFTYFVVILYFYSRSQGIDREVSWVSSKVALGTEAAGIFHY